MVGLLNISDRKECYIGIGEIVGARGAGDLI